MDLVLALTELQEEVFYEEVVDEAMSVLSANIENGGTNVLEIEVQMH